MTRRDLLLAGLGSVGVRRIRLGPSVSGRKPLRLAVIADLHHGLAPDAMVRLEAFCAATVKRGEIDAVLQLGDFNYSLPESKPCTDLLASLPHTKLHVLGNHDMDRCEKSKPVKAWGMAGRFYAADLGDYRFVVLDLNNFKKDGKLVPYANGNYFADGTSCDRADPEQLDWLRGELSRSKRPTILLSHQPLGFAEPGQALPESQAEVLQVISESATGNPAGAVAISMFGHLHVDRLERVRGVPYYCVNSASYFWYQGMHAYSEPLFAFMELGADGSMTVEGVRGRFVSPPPAASDSVAGRTASIENRSIDLGPSVRHR